VQQPIYATDDVALFVRDAAARRGPGIPPALRAWLKGKEGSWIPNALWWLDDVTPRETDAPLLLDYARWAFGPEGYPYARAAAVRALGRVHDAVSERFLRGVVARSWPDGSPPLDRHLEDLATAALARRGLPDAIRDLDELHELGLALEAAPGFAVARLRTRLLDQDEHDAACEELAEELRQLSFHGVRLEETLFAGIAEAALASDLGGLALADIAIAVPGCRRADLANAAMARLDPAAWVPGENESLPLGAAGFLYSADPQRFVSVLRAWSDAADPRVRGAALGMLLRIGDPPSAEKLIGIVDNWTEYDLLPRTRAPAVERFLAERAAAGNEDAAGALRAYRGIPAWLADLAEGAPATKDAAIAFMLKELGAAEEMPEIPAELGLVDDPRVDAWLRRARRDRSVRYWETLGALMLAGDHDAREELWSMVRCGRHRLLYSGFDERVFTLDWDFTTLPHWIEELDSNCCRVAGGLEGIFEDELGGAWLWGRPDSGIGEPRSRRARTDLLWWGGDYLWSPLVDHFVAKPD